MALIIQKYGGTSVADSERIRNVAQRAIKTKEAGNDVIVVVSAMAGETDKLINLAQELVRLPEGRELDVLISTGEQVASPWFPWPSSQWDMRQYLTWGIKFRYRPIAHSERLGLPR